MTGRHAALIGYGLGADSWNPDPTSGPVTLMAVLGAFVAVDSGQDYDGVLDMLRMLPLVVLARIVSEP